jgi:Ca2+-binding EF-hand superfamily protein
VLACCGYTSARDRLKCLRRIADDEERQLAHDMLDNAVEKMQRVQDEKELEQVEKDAKYTGLARHDTGLQVIVLLFRRLCGKTPAPMTPRKQEHPAEATQDLERGHARMSSTDKPAALPVLPKRFFFSRKVIHFMVKLLLVLNGFFFALMCQAVLYDLPPIAAEFGAVVAVLIPLPLVLNITVLQPRIFRDYVLVACLFKVDVATLSEVITQFSESVELRTEFVDHLTSRMREQGQTLSDLRRHFHASDPTNSGCIELEELRQILRHFGCQVSYFRFNDVAKLLFRLKGTCVEYAQVERLLELAAMEDHARESMAPGAAPQNGAPHYMRTVMTEEAELHRRERCSTMEPTMQQQWRVLNDTLTPQRMHFARSSSFPIVLTPLTPPLHSPAPVLGPARSPETAYRSVQESRYLAHL